MNELVVEAPHQMSEKMGREREELMMCMMSVALHSMIHLQLYGPSVRALQSNSQELSSLFVPPPPTAPI